MSKADVDGSERLFKECNLLCGSHQHVVIECARDRKIFCQRDNYDNTKLCSISMFSTLIFCSFNPAHTAHFRRDFASERKTRFSFEEIGRTQRSSLEVKGAQYFRDAVMGKIKGRNMRLNFIHDSITLIRRKEHRCKQTGCTN